MRQSHQDRTPCRISIVDEDPLRARREIRELLAELTDAEPSAALDIPRDQPSAAPAADTAKGGVTAELVGLVFSGSTLLVAVVQTWLARVPQRTIVAKRPDGTTLSITGREARQDDQRLTRFLNGDDHSGKGTDGEGRGHGEAGDSAPDTGEGNGPAAD
ncbi:effector-associated constant component EACC1 [Streptomyces sparsus]